MLTGVVVEKNTLLVAGSLVFHVNLSVDVPTTVMRFVMTGAVTSAFVPVVKETGEDNVTFPAASRERTTAKYVVLVLRPVNVKLCDVTSKAEDTTCVAVALVFTGVVVEKNTALSAASFVFQTSVAVVVAGVATTEEMTGAVVSGATTIDPVVKDISVPVVLFFALSFDATTTKYVVLGARFLITSLWAVTLLPLETERALLDDAVAGEVVEKVATLVDFSSVCHVITALFVLGVMTTLLITGPTASF
jgi:hypothetical protein